MVCIEAMLRGLSFVAAVATATLAAAPLAVTSVALLDMIDGENADQWLGLASHGLTGVVFNVWLIGAMIAILPVAFGTATMALLGIRFGWARSWFAWGLAGIAPMLVFALLIDPGFLFPKIAAMLLMTGMGCALVSRFFIQWARPAPQA